MGAEVTAQWSLDNTDGTEKAFCCLYATAKDFARLGKLFLQKGKWNGKQIVSEQYVTESISPANMLDEWEKPLNYYGYQFPLQFLASTLQPALLLHFMSSAKPAKFLIKTNNLEVGIGSTPKHSGKD